MKEDWKNYITTLKNGHVRLTYELDDLVWNLNEEGGYFSGEMGYTSGLTWDPVVNSKWWKAYLRVSDTLMEKLLIWLVLKNKALTWDIFQNRSF